MQRTTQVPCSLFERDGKPISRAVATYRSDTEEGTFVISQLERPGHLVKRCLLGGVRDLLVRLGEGTLKLAKLERSYFDAHDGRVCLLQVQEVPVRVDERLQ